jgi:5'-AMP-activated protein kinase, catalytic alpha subunit
MTQQCLEANRHNNFTTTYYLLMKKYLRNGGISKADPSCKEFDLKAIEPNER